MFSSFGVGGAIRTRVGGNSAASVAGRFSSGTDSHGTQRSASRQPSKEPPDPALTEGRVGLTETSQVLAELGDNERRRVPIELGRDQVIDDREIQDESVEHQAGALGERDEPRLT